MAPTVKRFLVITGLVWAVYSSVVVSPAQQPKRLPPAEPANIIRLRQQWFYQQRAYPNKHIPPGARLKALQQLRKMEAAQRATSRQIRQQSATSTGTSTSSATQPAAISSTSWTPVGPQPTTTPFAYNPVSGRITALAVDPTNSDVVYVGGAQGGVWKTTDGGNTWAPLTDDQPSLAVGSITIDPGNSQTIYVGTGEENFSGDSYAGAGVLKSTDGGSTWTQLAGPFVGPFGSNSPYCGGAYIGSTAVDPGNNQVVLAGAVFSCGLGSGIYRSTDGGTSWTEVLGTAQTSYMVTGLVFDPTNGNNVYASVGYGASSNNGIWKSTDAGLTWTLDNGSGTTAFPGSQSGRISLAIAPSSPTTLYAGAGSAASGNTSTLGVYKTTDGGATWTQLVTAPPYCGQQCWYDNVVAVSPTDPNIVLLGGKVSGTLYLSLDGGVTWSDITQDSSGNAIHPDMHAIAFSSDGATMYVGNDGGAWSTSLSAAGVGSWTDLNQQLALTQFYPGMSLNPTTSNIAFAGSQDNGTQEYTGQPAWDWIACGDGGQTAFDYSTLNTLYAGCQYVPPNPYTFLYKLMVNSGATFVADNGIDGNDRGAFIPPLAMDSSNPNTLYFGTYRIYQTTDGAANWTPISGDLTSSTQGTLSTISTITVAPGDSNTVYVGTGDGRLSVTTNANSGATWIPVTNGTPNRSVTAIAVNPTDSQTAYATFSGYSGFTDTLGHVFETTNGGTTWTDISGNLPNVPVNDIVLDPDFANTLYTGTDVGVFESADGGDTWAPLGTGLPVVAIMSLKLQRAARILSAASHGRSVWDIQLPLPVGPTALLSTSTLDFAAQQVGTTSPAQTVTLANNGSTDLTISDIVAGTNFGETNDCGTSLVAGGNCTISVTFAPTADGSQTGTVTITDNAANGSTQTINLNGTAFSGPATLSATSLSFADQVVGTTSAAQTVILTNNSINALTITAITAPTDFTINSDCPLSGAGTLAGGTSCNINVSFSPTATGTLAEQVTITDSATNSPQTILVTGTGVTGGGGSPAVTLSPISLDFASQAINSTSPAKIVTLTNSGTAALTISSIAASPSSFAETNNCPVSPATLSVGANCSISVTFDPSGTGSFTGALTITDDASGSQQSVALNGKGTLGGSTWARTWGGAQSDSNSAVATDSAGNVYIAGSTSSFGAGGQDVLLLKYDSTGNLVWAKTWGGSGDEAGNGVAVDSSGNVYVTGGTTSFGGGSNDVYLLKFDSAGNLLWSQTWGGSSYDVGYDVVIDATGNLYVAAESYSFGFAAVLLKYDTSGNLLWARTWKGPATYDSAYTVTVDPSGNAIEAGISWDYSVSPSRNSILLLKYDSSGNLLWTRNWAGPSEDEAWGSKAVQVDTGGNIYIAGREAAQCSSANFSTCDFDFLVLKVDPSGNEVWAKTWKGSTGWDGAGSLVFDSSGNLRVTGTIDAYGPSPAAGLLTFDTNGNLLSSEGWTGSSPTAGQGITTSGSTLIVAGSAPNNVGLWQPVSGTPGTETGTLSSPSGTVSTPTASTSSGVGVVNSPAGVVDTGGGGTDAFVVSGITNAPLAVVSTTNLTFSNQVVNTASTPQTLTITNSGNATLTFGTGAVTLAGANAADFATSADTCSGTSVAPNGTCSVNVTFTPSIVASESATLRFTDNAPNSPQTVSLTGTGVAAVPAVTLSPTSLAFVSQAVGSTSTPQTVTLTNSGSASLVISGITATGDFAETNNCPGILAATSSCTISVTFTPTTTGKRTGALSVADNAAGSPQTVNLSGTGAAPFVTFSPNSLTFQSLAVNTTSTPQTVTLTNSGNSSLTVSGIVTTGDFAETNNCPGSLAANASCTITITFTPTAAGTRTGTLSVTDNAPGSPQAVSLSGSGMDFSLAVASGFPSSITVTAGGSASDSLTLMPEGGFNQAVSLACTGAPSKATCTVSPASVTPDGTNPAQVTVKVTTTGASLAPPGPRGGPPLPGGFSLHEWWFALLLLLMLGTLALAFNERRRQVPLLAAAALLAAIAVSCGGGGGGGSTVTTPGTPSGTYTLTVTGTSGSLQHLTTVTLVVN